MSDKWDDLLALAAAADTEIIRVALKGARGLALDSDETALDYELGNAIDLLDRLSATIRELVAAARERDELRAALKDAVNLLQGGRQGYVGDHYIREIQVKQTTVDRLRAALHPEAGT